MFFGRYSGGISFYPDKVVDRSYTPLVVLTDFQLFGNPVEIGPQSPLKRSITYANGLTLSYEQNVFSFAFAALSYFDQAGNRYRYKLDGLDRQWTEVSSDRRLANYTTLPAGRYTFRVQAATSQGSWGEPGVEFGITILPAWWGTWWFRTFCAIAAVGTLWLVYLVRLRQVTRQFNVRLEERVSERTRIARDLHDTLLQSVQGLILKFHAVAKRIPDPDPARQDMEKALDYADQVLVEGRDRVRSLRSSVVSLSNLPVAFQRMADEMSRGNGTSFKTIVQGNVRELHPMVLEESYSIGREALINALAHSEGCNVEVEISYDPKQFCLRVRDNGRGIGPDIVEKGGRDGHWGIQGMRERANKIGADLKLWSRPGAGAEVEVTVPGKMAYLASHTKREFLN